MSFRQFFEGGKKSSMMRLMGFFALLAGITVGVAAVFLDRDLSAAGVLVASFLVPAFGGKAFQAFSENSRSSEKKEIGGQ